MYQSFYSVIREGKIVPMNKKSMGQVREFPDRILPKYFQHGLSSVSGQQVMVMAFNKVNEQETLRFV